ncbi:MAG: hypothetical protein R6V12_09830 [Candidatus Hydrogenedentota bacterium]
MHRGLPRFTLLTLFRFYGNKFQVLFRENGDALLLGLDGLVDLGLDTL